MTPALQLIAGLVLAGCTAGGAPVTKAKAVKPAPVVQPAPDIIEDEGPEIADDEIPIPDDFDSDASSDISEDNLEAELADLEAAIGD